MKIAVDLSTKLGLPEIQIEKILNGLRDHVAEELGQGNKVILPEFLIFDFKDNGERWRRNPRTGEMVLVAPNRAPKARFSLKFQDAVNLMPVEPTPAESTPSITPPALPVAVTPPPLPVNEPEKIYYLADGSQRPASEVKTLPPDSLIWHPEFGGAWRSVGDVF